MNSALISSEWLVENLGRPDLIILDTTLAKPKSASTDIPDHNLQIKGARFFDIDNKFSDKSINLPHMMCDTAQFEKEARSLGINNDSMVVVYDQHGVYSSPRAWWMLKSMGHENVAVLDGGLPEWVGKGYSTEPKSHGSGSGDFRPQFSNQCFVNSKYVKDHLNDPEVLVLDARSQGRFSGTEPEPREGLRGGHIPNSVSLPFTEVLNGCRVKSEDELKKLFDRFDLEGKRLVFSCGSGLTACIILLAAFVAGHKDLSVYDGSWSEWGQPGTLPVVKDGSGE